MLRFFFLAALLIVATGCIKKPKADLTGAYSNTAGMSLTLADGRFTLKSGQDTIVGETSTMGETLWLHPKSLNGRDQDAATMKAFKDAQEIGAVTDMDVLPSIYDTAELEVKDRGKTLVAKSKPRFKSGKEPFYNGLGTMQKTP